MVFVSMNNFKVASIIEKLPTTWKDIQKKKLLDIKKKKRKEGLFFGASSALFEN